MSKQFRQFALGIPLEHPKQLFLGLCFLMFSALTLAQGNSTIRMRSSIEFVESRESMKEALERLTINPKKYRMTEYCYCNGVDRTCESGIKRLSRMIKKFDKINEETRLSESKNGTWSYGISIMDETTIFVIGHKAVGMQVTEFYEFKKR